LKPLGIHVAELGSGRNLIGHFVVFKNALGRAKLNATLAFSFSQSDGFQRFASMARMPWFLQPIDAILWRCEVWRQKRLIVRFGMSDVFFDTRCPLACR
jgi:hypothetical protein